MKFYIILIFIFSSLVFANPNSLIYQGKFKEAYVDALASSHTSSFVMAAKAANLYAEFATTDVEEKIEYFQFAVEHADSAINIDKNDYLAHYQKAYAQARLIAYLGVLSKISLSESVKKHLNKALEIKPDHADSLAALALWNFALVDKGLAWMYGAKKDEIIPLFEQALALEPNSIEIRKHYAYAMMNMGEIEKAKEQFSYALELPVRSAVDGFVLARAQILLHSLE